MSKLSFVLVFSESYSSYTRSQVTWLITGYLSHLYPSQIKHFQVAFLSLLAALPDFVLSCLGAGLIL